MNSDLGVWTSQDSALVLIDYQPEIFATIRSETRADLAELNVRLLARTAKAFNMPIVLSSVGVGAGINGPTQPAILAELPGLQVIDRTTMNAFEDRAFSEAVKKTGRKRLIFGGLHTEICLTFAAIHTERRLPGDVRHRCRRWQIPNGAPHGDRTAGTRGCRPEYRARGPLRVVPRLDVTAGQQGARGHRLVFRGNPQGDRRRWRLR